MTGVDRQSAIDTGFHKDTCYSMLYKLADLGESDCIESFAGEMVPCVNTSTNKGWEVPRQLGDITFCVYLTNSQNRWLESK